MREFEVTLASRCGALCSPLPPSLPRLDDFKPYGKNGQWRPMAAAIQDMRTLIANPFEHPWMVLMGGIGCGKSMLLKAGLREIRPYAVYLQERDLHGVIHKSFQDQDTEEVVEALGEVPVLFLDDWGTQGGLGSDTVAGLTARILDRRYGFGTQRPTVVATNLLPDAMRQLDSRTADRLLDHQLSIQYQIRLESYRRGAV